MSPRTPPSLSAICTSGCGPLGLAEPVFRNEEIIIWSPYLKPHYYREGRPVYGSTPKTIDPEGTAGGKCWVGRVFEGRRRGGRI